MINLNDVLKLSDISNTKIRFNLMIEENWNPIELFQSDDLKKLMAGHYWNYRRNKSYQEGQVTIGFIKISAREDRWLLFHVGRVTKDLNKLEAVGYEYEPLPEYDKYIGRLVIKYKNKGQMMIRQAQSVIDECEVHEILPDIFDDDLFPGYEHVHLSWLSLARLIQKDTWKTALQNQKGIYLITDAATGKMYVGSAYGEQMLLSRWQDYVRTRHGNNVALKKLCPHYIEQNFYYSILDIFKSTVADEVILARESWWKKVLLTRSFGYNGN